MADNNFKRATFVYKLLFIRIITRPLQYNVLNLSVEKQMALHQLINAIG